MLTNHKWKKYNNNKIIYSMFFASFEITTDNSFARNKYDSVSKRTLYKYV